MTAWTGVGMGMNEGKQRASRGQAEGKQKETASAALGLSFGNTGLVKISHQHLMNQTILYMPYIFRQNVFLVHLHFTV